MEILSESNISSENTEDKVGEGSVENCDAGVSKAKVEDICNAFEKLDVLVADEKANDVDENAIFLDTENLNGPSRMKLEDTSSGVSEMDDEILESNVDVVLVDFVEQEPNKAPAEESVIEKAIIDVMPTSTIDRDSEQVNQEAEQTMDYAEEITLASVADDSLIKEENQVPMKATDVIDHPTSIRKMTLDNNENIGSVVVAVEENKNINEQAVDEKPKSLNDTSIRQLKKQLKALSIKNNTNSIKDDKVGEVRPAMQAVCKNQLVTEEMEDGENMDGGDDSDIGGFEG
ncbi:hypothetical protein Ccrd_025071 [Cynara cardunculus var. scolymus]|uniref:Uncharacterized protein n=1 Tax=Cynara cardunculus var. scolymus TaxID=59895 RepID=A0A103XBG5_CYNCS|nr:hypothetical protein Ccrd_025071 [Cynara cardunculus var. scolymus]